jgi:hypothetical protein
MWNHKQVVENLKVSQMIDDGGLAHHLFLLGTSLSSNCSVDNLNL